MAHNAPDAARPTIGAVAIARNEAEDLPGLLATLLPWVDEVVVVDDGSTDGTQEIARRAGPKVRLVERPMGEQKDFAAQRNAGVAAATAEWLLHLDVDERITPELADEIVAAARSGRHDAYRVRRLNFFLHRPMRYGGWQRDNPMRFGRRSALTYTGWVHEGGGVPAGSSVGQLREWLLHLNDASYPERIRKNMIYSQVEARKILERGTRVGVRHLLLYPLWRAFRSYVLERGFLAGKRGLILGVYTFWSTFNWFACAYDQQVDGERESAEAAVLQRWTERARDGRAGEPVARRGAPEPLAADR